jgi:hypothetical protein
MYRKIHGVKGGTELPKSSRIPATGTPLWLAFYIHDKKGVTEEMPRVKSAAAPAEKKTTTRAKKVAAPVNGNGTGPVNLEEKIRARAYELYQRRGAQHGAHESDWYAAEAELRSHTA